MEFKHYSVMLKETIESMNIQPDGIYIDGTAGGAGHSSEIAKRLTTGRLLALDQDPVAVKAATEKLSAYSGAKVVQVNFSQMDRVLINENIDKVDGILLDLGVSSVQLDVVERGFSYHNDAPLDMRMASTGLSAYDVVNDYSVEQISRILKEYGEEQFAYKIAKEIEKQRNIAPIETTLQLADIIKTAVPAFKKRDKNPCKKTFQAIRIEVNNELGHLRDTLDVAFDSLKVNGRLAIITFHSLEDRMVKHKYLEWCKGCECPPQFPVCVCGKTPRGKLVNRKPISASQEELDENRRSRSAMLRVIEKIQEC